MPGGGHGGKASETSLASLRTPSDSGLLQCDPQGGAAGDRDVRRRRLVRHSVGVDHRGQRVVTVPLIVLVLLFQRRINSGLTVGAIR